MSRGIGAYRRAGEVSGPAGTLSKAKTPTIEKARPEQAASSSRAQWALVVAANCERQEGLPAPVRSR